MIHRLILLLSFAALLLGCSKEDPDIILSMPQADFNYVVVKDGNEVIVSFKNKCVDADNFEWRINEKIVFRQKELTIKVKNHQRISVRLTAFNDIGEDTKLIEIELPFEDNSVKGVSYSWWCDPISQYNNGFNYFSGIDTLGRQMIFLYHPQLNKIISKVINSGHKRDEHNTASFIFVGNNILSACAGHDQENVVKIKMFDANLNGPFLHETNVHFPGSASYSQLQRSGKRIFLSARCTSKWYITWSDDDGVTWKEPKLFIKKAIRPNNSFYIRTIAVSDKQIVVGAYMHPVDMKDDGQKLFYANLNTETGEITKEDGVGLGNLYNPSYSALELFDMTLVHQPAVGETFRFLDIATMGEGDRTVFLIADANSNNFATGNYALVERIHSEMKSKVTTIVPHGKSLPHPTYWGGAYFVVDHFYKWSGRDISLAREAQNHWMVEKYAFNGSSFSLIKQIENYISEGDKTLSRPLPPIGSESGGLSVIYQKGLYYGWPSYTNWTNMELVLVDASLNPIPSNGLAGEIIELKGF